MESPKELVDRIQAWATAELERQARAELRQAFAKLRKVTNVLL